MKRKIESVIASIEAQKLYVEENSDYSEAYDILLADDSAYHAEQWQAAIAECLDANQSEYLNEYVQDKIVRSILDSVTYFCNIAVRNPGFVAGRNPLAIASFTIGEEYVQIDETLTRGQVQYIERETDARYCNGGFYLDYSYAFVEYELIKDRVSELFDDIAQSEFEDYASLLLSDARGIYIPRDFLDFEKFKVQLSNDEIETLANPDSEFYWDIWETVLHRTYTIDGREYTLHQDGDLWAIDSRADSVIWYSRG